MSLTLAAGETLRGVADAATSITYTIMGDEVASGDAFKVLAQGQLPASIGTLYTVPAATATIVKSIHLVNTAGATRTASLAVNGTSGAYQILPPISILAGGFAVYGDHGWTVYNDQGQALSVGATGAAGSAGVGVPTGGAAGQRLAKIDGTDYNTEWVTPAAASIDLAGDTGSATGIGSITFSGADVTDDGGGAATVTVTGGGGSGNGTLAMIYVATIAR